MNTRSNNLWQKLSPLARKKLVWGLWFVTWLLLLAGLFERGYYEAVVAFSGAHLLLFMVFFRFDLRAFPIQLRIGYLLWVAAGTYVPGLVILMYITTIGLATNLFWGYCPMARMLYLLPWNREERFSMPLLKRVILTPPVEGAFHPAGR